MKNHHEVGHFKNRLMIGLLSLLVIMVMAGQSFAATTCSTCHGMPPLDSADGSRVPATGAFRGNHQIHMGASAAPGECTKCHGNSGYGTDHAAVSGNMIKINSNINGSPLTGTYSKSAPFAQTATPVMGSCSNVNCHFEKSGGSAPVWGTIAPVVDCNTCHATPRGASGSHAKHEAKYACSQCHPDYGTTLFKHATSAGRHKIVTKTFLTYSGGTATSWLPSQTKSFGSCRATACHDTGRDNPRTPVWGTSTAACATCHAAAPATFSHSKHLSGLDSLKFTKVIACADCHNGVVQSVSANVTDHIDGNIDIYYITNSGSANTAGDLGYISNKTKGSALSSCSTANCHSNGKSTFASATWGGISTGCDFCHPAVNLSAGHSTHIGSLLTSPALKFYNFTSNKSVGGNYQFGCGTCHPNSVASHLDGAVEVDLAPSVSGGAMKSRNLAGATMNGAKCSNVYCHSNGYVSGTFKCVTTLAWTDKFANYTAVSKGSKDSCAWCHGNSPNNGSKVGSSAHSAHVVGIHYDTLYNGVSKKLPQSGGATVNAAHGRDSRSTTINCNICHAATVTTSYNDKNSACTGCHNGSTAPLKGTAAVADKSKHVNGKVDVNFINSKIATKAQVAQSAFAAYTAAGSGGWSRNKNIYKTYTSGYDVTKAALSASPAYTAAAGCAVACHGNIVVKWSDAVTCTSCHTRLK